jgi:hypothetical protein
LIFIDFINQLFLNNISLSVRVYNYLKYNESNTPKKGILFNLKVNKKKGVFDFIGQ